MIQPEKKTEGVGENAALPVEINKGDDDDDAGNHHGRQKNDMQKPLPAQMRKTQVQRQQRADQTAAEYRQQAQRHRVAEHMQIVGVLQIVPKNRKGKALAEVEGLRDCVQHGHQDVARQQEKQTRVVDDQRKRDTRSLHIPSPLSPAFERQSCCPTAKGGVPRLSMLTSYSPPGAATV